MNFKAWKSYVLLAPATILLVIFVLYPLFYTFYLSFFDWNMIRPEMKFVGIKNYMDIFTDSTFPIVIGNTFVYFVIIAITNCLIPYLFAFVCRFILTKFQTFYKVSIFLPSFISLVVASTMFVWILNPITGPVAALLGKIGLTMPLWSKSQGLAIVVISLITTWGCFGYNFITLFAAISSIPLEIIETARLDNIPLRKIFTKIVIPVSGAFGYYVFIMTIVEGLSYVFAPIDVITSGGPDYGTSNLIYDSYFKAFKLFDTGKSAAMTVITLIIVGLLIMVINRIIGKRVYYAN